MPPNEQDRPQAVDEALSALSPAEPTSTKPWYKKDIGPRLKPATRELYQHYSGLADDEIVPHLHAIRDRAWPYGEYPCVGEWIFLHPSIARYPQYAEVLARLKSGATVLDLGCCFGQDLRRLAADGAPTTNMIASDLHAELWQLGYDLFRDRATMRARFVQADVLAPDYDDDDTPPPLRALAGGVDFVFLCQFLHLFGWAAQRQVWKRVVAMSRPGGLVLGYQIGRVEATAVRQPWGTLFLHNEESFRRMVGCVAEETGTRWEVELLRLGSQAEWGLEEEDFAWMGPLAKGLDFVVRRVDSGEGGVVVASL